MGMRTQCREFHVNNMEGMTFEEKKMIRQSLLVPLLSLPCSYPSNLGEIQPMQLEDDIIAPVMNAVKEGKIPDCNRTKPWSRESCQWNMLTIKHGTLWSQFSDDKRGETSTYSALQVTRTGHPGFT